MSVADLHDLELIWPSLGPTDVIVTGTFDQWSSSIHLVKGDVGFVATVKVPCGQKVAYKFIVDGHWQCRDDRPQEEDGNGNTNNILQTPEKPELAAVHDPPARLSIPLDGALSEDMEYMVTAVEFLPPAEPAAIRSLPFPIPQISITVAGLDQVPDESKLNTAGATEGNISPASVTLAPFTQAPSAGSLPLPPIGEAPDGFVVQLLPIQASVAEVAVPPAQLDAPPVAVFGSTAKQPEVDFLETAAQGHRRQAATPASHDRVSTPSTPASSTLTQKKRRSLFARIKHIFDKDKDKQERKEKNKP